jgi:hypothetical protein
MMLGAAALCTAGLGLALGGAAGANVPGTGAAGTPNCAGQTTAYLTQGRTFEYPGPGLGNEAREAGFTLTQEHQGIQTYCITGIVP